MPPANIASTELTHLSDDELVEATRRAWIIGLTHNTFGSVRNCQNEAMRRNKVHLYDRAYIEFWIGIGSDRRAA